MKIAVDHVSVSEAGDYFQTVFEDEDDSSGAYLLLQRQFEDEDGGRCYIETHDRNYVGHFRVKHARLGKTDFSVDLWRKSHSRIHVTFRRMVEGHAEVARILKIMIPAIDLIAVGDAC